jgi:endonuclease III
VKDSAEAGRNLRKLLRNLGRVAPPELPSVDDPIEVLVLSFLMWESTTGRALAAYRDLRESVVDFNDLRVCMPGETVEMIGVRYPLALERAQRLRAVLRDIYLREHAVTLRGLQELGRRDARKYIESLEGMVQYAGARLLLLCCDVHVIPVDEQLREQLLKSGILKEQVELSDLAGWMSRQVRTGTGLQAHYALQAWVDEGRPLRLRGARPPAAPPGAPAKAGAEGPRDEGTKG